MLSPISSTRRECGRWVFDRRRTDISASRLTKFIADAVTEYCTYIPSPLCGDKTDGIRSFPQATFLPYPPSAVTPVPSKHNVIFPGRRCSSSYFIG